ncbi:MAG: hypothetical protein MUP76_08385 [Acidimicrobiia bacterium]|nr:hypothetical protein [Acidimicrobiia bacterium]
MPIDPAGQMLHTALVTAYVPYLQGMLDERGLDAPGLGAALDEGKAWLDEALDALLALPFDRQSRGPFELFQEAVRFPTAALSDDGVEPAPRDAAAAAALPGDIYDLAPTSSQSLGEEVWGAHLAWGAAKAAAFRPTVGLLSADLMDRSKIEPVVGAAGFRLIVWRAGSDLEQGSNRPALALVDLSHGDADDAIRFLAAAGIRVIGFGPHVDDMAMVRARTLGAIDAVPRSVFFRTLERLLPTAV